MKDSIIKNIPSGATKPVEVVDKDNRPLLVMPLGEVHRQLLLHRSVVVLVFNTAGKLYLQKRSRSKTVFPARWDVSSSGHILSGESEKDAAKRELQLELNIQAERLRFIKHLPASPGTGFEFTTIFSLERYHLIPDPNPVEVEEGYFYSSEELQYLIRDFRELLSPHLLHLWEQGLPFPIKNS